MAPREPTSLEVLRDTGRYIDHSLLPTQNEIPGVLAALIYGSDLADQVSQYRKDGLTDAQISHEVAHTIAPPDPEAGANIVQGVPPEAHQALLDEVAALREQVNSLSSGGAPQLSAPASSPAAAVAPVTPGQTTSGAGPVANPADLSAEQQELQALREQVQRQQVQQAAGQHPYPTTTSEPVVEGEPVPERQAE